MFALLAAAAAQSWTLALQECSGSATFTLHGLWPNSDDCSQEPFDMSKIQNMTGELEQYWRSCPEFHSNNNEFWTHEWETHGVCSGMDEATFFSTALRLRLQYAAQCS